MNNKLHKELMACPVCGGELIHLRNKEELVCRFDRLAFPIRDQIPVLIEDEARELAADEEITDS